MDKNCLSRATVGVQVLSRVELSLPTSGDYMTWNFHRDIGQDLNKAEK